MKRLHSLKGRNLFKEVYGKGGRFKVKGFRVFVLKFDDKNRMNSKKKILSNNRTKIGLSINKKYGKAYMRNKAKRRIRSICTELLDEMNDGFYIIIKPELDFKNMSYEKSKWHIRSLLQRAGVVN